MEDDKREPEEIVGSQSHRGSVSVSKTIRLLEAVIKQIGIDGKVEAFEDSEIVKITIDSNGENPALGLLIGKHGETLDAIQTIANVVLRREGDRRKVFVDAEQYRKRRESILREIAERAAEKAIHTGRSVLLRPMNSYDRRIVHLELCNNKSVYTESEGEEPNRKIRVTPKEQ